MTDESAPSQAQQSGKTIVMHLVSHASGELVEMIARNAVAQLEGVDVDRHLWKMVRNVGLIPEILAEIAWHRGIVFHSIAATDIREALEDGCRRLRVPCLFVLEPFVSRLAEYSGAAIKFKTAAHDRIDEDYYRRVEAMKYTLAHDDGLASDDLEDADVVLVGVSRATKTPTCMYLASRGIKAANVPVVPGVPLPDGVTKAKSPLVLGLTLAAEGIGGGSCLPPQAAERGSVDQLRRNRIRGARGAGGAQAVRPARLEGDRRHQPPDREHRRFYPQAVERAGGEGGWFAGRPGRGRVAAGDRRGSPDLASGLDSGLPADLGERLDLPPAMVNLSPQPPEADNGR